MQFSNDNIFTTKISDIISFGSFIGKYEAISLQQDIKDKNGNILISAKRPLRESTLKSLLNKELASSYEISLVISKELRDALADKVSKEFRRIISLSDFSFPAFLFEKKNINMHRIIRVTMRNRFFMNFLTKILYENKKIKIHLLEVCAISTGLMASLKGSDYRYAHFMRLFQAAILHDYAISELPNWDEEEAFEGKSKHDMESANKISGNELSSDISEIILKNNHLNQEYSNDDLSTEDSWFNNPVKLSSAILNLAEYYTYAKRLIGAQNNKDEMGLVMYQIGVHTEKGYFPRQLVKILETYFRKYAVFFEYGKQIGALQNQCIHKKFALAYPKPKATQILCKNNSVPCKLRLYGQPLMVVSAEGDTWARLGEQIRPGWHDKCNLSVKLPTPPNIF